MVYVKQIVLRNFKSFHGTVKLNLAPGFTVITGPNGSGKSNIIDAFQFVLGELGPRRMRVSSLSGVIYDGAGEAGGRKVDYAQVTLKFDNSDRGIAIDKGVVSIGRRVDREGRSKYFLNGKPVSRKTVINLLKMAGISAEGYNIVLQGTATRLSDITPIERMRAIESLIGITEYDEKKAEAKKRLEEAERKVEVAAARIDEVRKRLISLERERNDALRYQFLKEEERRLKARRLSYEVLRVEAEIERLNQGIKAKEEELRRLEAERGRLLSERAEAKEALERFSQEAAEKGNTRLPLINSEVVRQREIIGALRKRGEEIERRRGILLRSMKEWREKLERLRGEGEEVERKIKTLSGEISSLEGEIKEKESLRLGLSERISQLREEVERGQRRIEELEERLGPIRESLEGLEIEINRHLLALETLRERLKGLNEKMSESDKRIENLKKNLREFEELKRAEEKKLEDFLRDLEQRVERQKNLRRRAEEASDLVSKVENAIIEFTAKRDLWERIATEEKALQRIEEMGKSGAIPGYHGILRGLIKVPQKYRRAVEASSDGWINAVVVEDLSSALRCIKSLKKSEMGMVRILPLQEVRPVGVREGATDEGLIAPIPSLVRCREKFSSLVNLVWGDTLLVKNVEAALRVSSQGYRAVTPSGDVYEPEGGMMGGHYRSILGISKIIPSKESVVKLSKTIKALKRVLNKKMRDLKLSGGDLRKVSSYIEDSRKHIENLENNIEQIAESIRRAERNRGLIERKVKETLREIEREEGLIASLRERKERTLKEMERLKGEISKLSGRKPSDVASLEVQAAQLDKELEALRKERGELERERLMARGRLESLIKPKISDLEKRLLSAADSLKALEEENVKVRGELEKAEKILRELEEERSALTEAVESTSRVMRLHQEKIKGIEAEIEKIERRMGTLEQERMELSLEVERRRLHVEQLMKGLRELGQAEPIPTGEDEIKGIERALRAVRSEIERIGAINQLAVEQYDEQMRNYKQLSIRINELEEEKASILKFIEEIEEEKLRHFMKSFNEICENFTEFFSKLTGGGEGRLEFQNPQDPFSAGIDLYVQFPGKPMRLASGASGGERSVAAIAYLLAIQKFLKAPFYLFDEIDAHLDDLNTDRLAEVLRENSAGAQFIVITLKDAMINRAERVYGCFSRGGRSRVVTLPRLEVVT
ncbi:chromosome segregation protein SMC [Candidatus Bathyarchaeota archaeon]|nr:chromosome segregation protein SMC [Candidatus Bathyarchaeota archaeon]